MDIQAHSDSIEGRSWWRLGTDGWKDVLKSTGKEFSNDEVSNLSAVVTLRIVLALVPSMIAVVAIAATVVSPEDIEEFVASAEDFIPESSQEFVVQQLNDIIAELQRGAIGVIGIAAGIFAASGASVALMGAMNKAYDVEEKRSFVFKRIGSLGVLAALSLSLIGMFVVIVLGPTLLELVVPEEVLDSPAGPLITLSRYGVAVLILIMFFGFVFWFAPNRDKPRLRLLTPGAVLGVVGWLLLSYLFSLYARISGSYSATYGVFAGIIVLLVWLNYSFQVLLMGAELDHEIEKHLRSKAETEPGGTPADLDEVTPDMPRHPGLVASGDGHRARAAEQESAGDGQIQSTPSPRLVGAAAHTPGAGLASKLWGRMG